LFFDESDGFLGVVNFADFADVAQGDQGGDASAGDETDDDGEVFEHEENVLIVYFNSMFSGLSVPRQYHCNT